MIKTDISKEEYRRLIQVINYRGVELKETRPLPYDENQTPIQRQIEMSVTHGRGYTHAQDSLNVVNSRAQLPQLDLYDVFDTGLVPLHFKEPEPLTSDTDTMNPLGEIFLGEPTKVNIFEIRPRTFLERLMIEQNVKWEINKYTILGSSLGIEPIFSLTYNQR